jgi:quercetin dioxygenase-like cupin family protein
MKKFHHSSIEPKEAGDGAKGVRVRWLIDRGVGAENFAMRLFEMDPGGETPLHRHPWEHEIFFLEGSGVVAGGGVEEVFGPGDVVFIPPNELHQIRGGGRSGVKFLCLIPLPRTG